MWFAIVLIASLLLASTIAPKADVENARVQGLGDNAFPTSKYGDIVPIVWGTCEQKSPVVLWFGHYQPIGQYEEVSTGAFSSERVITSYRYLLGFDLGICLGPNIELQQIKAEGGRVVWHSGLGSEIGGSDDHGAASIQREDMSGAVSFWSGNDTQIVDPYISGGPGAGIYDGVAWSSGAGLTTGNLPNYRGTCHVSFIQFYIGDDNPVPPRFSFVVKNTSQNLSASWSVMSNDLDINPMEIVYTVLTQKWGMLGLDPALIDQTSFLAAAQTLHTEGLGMSMIVSRQKPVKDIIKECMRVADGVLYQDPSDGLFKVKLIRNDYTVGNLLVLDESNTIGKLEDFGRTTWEDTRNQVKLTFQSRENNYQDQVIVVQDSGNIKRTDSIRPSTITMPGVRSEDTARILAERELSLLSSPLLKCTLNANREAKDLRPGSLFVLNYSPYGLTNAVMRVTKIDFGTLDDNRINVRCVQDRFSVGLESFSFPEENAHTNIDLNAYQTTSFRIYDAPFYFLKQKDYVRKEDIEILHTEAQALVLADAPSENSVSFNVHISSDNNPSFSKLLNEQVYLGSGNLQSSVGYDGFETGIGTPNTWIIENLDQRVIDNLVNNATLDDARNGSSMFIAASEVLMFVGFTDLGDGSIRLHDVYRNVLTGAFVNLGATQEVWFIRKGMGTNSITVPASSNLNYKIATNTPVGSFDISTIGSTSATLFGFARIPYKVCKLQVNGKRPTGFNSGPFTETSNYLTVSWQPRHRTDPSLYAYMEDASSDYDEDFWNNGLRFTVELTKNGSVVRGPYNTSNNSYGFSVTGLTGSHFIRVRVYHEDDSGFTYTSGYEGFFFELT